MKISLCTYKNYNTGQLLLQAKCINKVLTLSHGERGAGNPMMNFSMKSNFTGMRSPERPARGKVKKDDSLKVYSLQSTVYSLQSTVYSL